MLFPKNSRRREKEEKVRGLTSWRLARNVCCLRKRNTRGADGCSQQSHFKHKRIHYEKSTSRKSRLRYRHHGSNRLSASGRSCFTSTRRGCGSRQRGSPSPRRDPGACRGSGSSRSSRRNGRNRLYRFYRSNGRNRRNGYDRFYRLHWRSWRNRRDRLYRLHWRTRCDRPERRRNWCHWCHWCNGRNGRNGYDWFYRLHRFDRRNRYGRLYRSNRRDRRHRNCSSSSEAIKVYPGLRSPVKNYKKASKNFEAFLRLGKSYTSSRTLPMPLTRGLRRHST